jgi:cell division septation protein DedD
MAEDPEPEEAAPGSGPLIDISELVETGPAARAVRPLKPARRPARPEAGRTANRGLGLLGHILQALIVLLVVVWVFLLGVLVGRSRPEEKALAGWLEKTIGWAGARPGASPTAQSQPPTDRPPHPAGPAPVDPGRAEPDPSEPEVLKAAPEPAALAGPADEAPPAAELEPLFAVQTTLARDETEANPRVAQLAAQGFPAYFYNNGRRFYIRVGPFPTRAEAEDSRRRLEELGYKGPYVSKLR